MTHTRIARAEHGALEDRSFQRALEARRPPARTRTILLHDDEEPPAPKAGQKRILVRIITTRPRGQVKTGRERVLPAKAKSKEAPRPAGQEKRDRPAEGKRERYSKPETQEPTTAELEAELQELEAEIAELEREAT